MRIDVSRIVGFGLLLLGVASIALGVPVDAPEIDPGMATLPLALLGGAALIVRSRIRRRQQ